MSSRIEALKFIKEDKSEITVVVDIVELYNVLKYRIADIYIREFRKQKRLGLRDKYKDDYQYRQLNQEERKNYMRDKYLEYITEEQMQLAIMNAWELCRPEINSIDDIDVF